MKYIYQARSKEGRIETGTVEASSKEAAAALLQKYDVFVTSLKEETSFIPKASSIGFLNKVSKKDLAIFSRQLSITLQSRVPVVQALTSLAMQSNNRGLREKILKITQLVEEGNPLSLAMASFPETFNTFYVSVIRAGEASGKSSESLYSLSNHLEKEYDISAQLKGALVYPVFVIVVLFLVLFGAMVFVIPRLVLVLRDVSVSPPPLTLAVIRFYSFLETYGLLILFFTVVLAAAVFYYSKTKSGKQNMDILVLDLPIVGELMKKMCLIRFAESTSTLIGSGVSITKVLQITKDTVGNYVYEQILDQTSKKVAEGEKISDTLVGYQQYFPPFVIQIIQVGEETGKLDNNLIQIVDFYQKDVNRTTTTMLSLVEPVLIVFLGVIVALLGFSIIGPIYESLGAI